MYVDSKNYKVKKLEKEYKTYANEIIEIAIRKPFNLLETVEKSARSSAS